MNESLAPPTASELDSDANLAPDSLLTESKADSSISQKSWGKLFLLSGLLVTLAVAVVFILLPTFKQTPSQMGSEFKIPTSTPSSEDQQPSPPVLSAVAAVSPKPKRPIATGEQIYFISTAKEYAGPRMKRVVFSQLVPAENETGLVTAEVDGATPAESVRLSVISDTKVKTVRLSLKSVTDQIQIWEGSWQLEDSVATQLIFKFELTGVTGVASSSVTIR